MGLRTVTAATGLKRLGLAGAVVIAAGFAGLSAASLLVSADGARDAVKAQIRAVTGLDPILRGPVAVSLFPSGTVRLSDVVLGEADGGTPPLVAAQLIARLRLLPLLVGRIEIADITLDHPHIALRIDANGRTNWSPLLASLARALTPIDRIPSFTEIRIDNGAITVNDTSHSLVEELTKVDLSLAWPSISKSFGATGTFHWRKEPVEASVLISDFLAALTGDTSGLKVRLSGAPLKLAFEGAMSSEPSFKVDGMLSAEAASLRDALRWTGDTPVPTGGFGRFTLKGQAKMVESAITLSGVNVELDGNAVEGSLSYAANGQRTWQGTLAADALDLTPYVSAIRLMAANPHQWDRVPIVLDGLTGFAVDLRLSAAKVRIGRARFGRTALSANQRDGKLLVSIGESQAYGGMIHGSIAIAKTEAGAEVKSEMEFSDIDFESCLGELFGLHRIEGKGKVNLALEGVGESVLALTHSVSGTVKLVGQQGALTGINVEQVLRRLERRPLSPGDYRSGQTPYESLAVRLNVTNGTVTVDEATVDGNKVRIALSGTASIPTRELDLKGTASLLSGTNEVAFALPFIVNGPWEDAMPLPDTGILIQRSGAAAPLLKSLSDSKVRSALERLIGPHQAAPAAAAGAAAAGAAEQ